MKKSLKIELLKIKKSSLLSQELTKYQRLLLSYVISVRDGSEKNTSLIRSTRSVIAFISMLINKNINQSVVKN